MTSDDTIQTLELVETADFELRAVFDKKSRDPQRVFQTLSELIPVLQELDHLLLQSIDPEFEAELILDDIEIGSIRTILKTFIKSLPDEGLLDLDYKRILGQYLVNCKYMLLKWLDGKYEINGRTDLNAIIGDLFKEAEKIEVTPIPAPTPISDQQLVKVINKIQHSLRHLHATDSVEYISKRGKVSLNKELQVDNLDKLLVEQSETFDNIMIMKVKMPDYLGEKMWEFRYDNHVVDVKINDYDWLQQFQQGDVDLKPGDSLKAKVQVVVDYGYNHEVIHKHYFLVKVIEIIHNQKNKQYKIF